VAFLIGKFDIFFSLQLTAVISIAFSAGENFRYAHPAVTDVFLSMARKPFS
jgi:hypothetical protein